jgi:hypothetical protein
VAGKRKAERTRGDLLAQTIDDAVRRHEAELAERRKALLNVEPFRELAAQLDRRVKASAEDLATIREALDRAAKYGPLRVEANETEERLCSALLALNDPGAKEIVKLRRFRNRLLGEPDKRRGRGKNYEPELLARHWQRFLGSDADPFPLLPLDKRWETLRVFSELQGIASAEAARKALERAGVKGLPPSWPAVPRRRGQKTVAKSP